MPLDADGKCCCRSVGDAEHHDLLDPKKCMDPKGGYDGDCVEDLGACKSGSSSPSPPASGAAATDKLKVTGRLAYKPSWSFVPGAKDPSGKTSGSVDLVVEDVKFDPPQPPGATLKSVLELDAAPAMVTEPSVGKCKATLSSHKSLPNLLAFSIEEPGCDVFALTRAPMSTPFTASAKGKALFGGAPRPVEVQFDLRPGEKTFDEVVKEKSRK